MISYLLLYVASYWGLYTSLASFAEDAREDNYIAHIMRQIILVYLSHQLSYFLWRKKFVPKSRVIPDDKAVLITGCDSGFGNLLARKLDKDRFRVYAACLDPDGEGAKRLDRETSGYLKIIKLDVTSDTEANSAYELISMDLEKLKGELLAVVNNAGILATGEVEFGKDLRPFERQLEVNCLGTIRITRTFAPLLRRCKGYPRLVNVTSMAAHISLPGMVGYCVSKNAALSFTDGIRTELRKWNIQVVSIEPHLFRTNLIAMKDQHEALRKLWDESRAITREDYGEKFFQGATKLLDHGIGTARTNIDDVVDAMYNSITLKWPETHAKVCSSEWERLGCWFMLNILPQSVQNFLLSFGASFITGKPALLG